MLDQIKQIIVGLLAEREGITEVSVYVRLLTSSVCSTNLIVYNFLFLFQQKQGLFVAFAKQLESAISAVTDKYSEKL